MTSGEIPRRSAGSALCACPRLLSEKTDYRDGFAVSLKSDAQPRWTDGCFEYGFHANTTDGLAIGAEENSDIYLYLDMPRGIMRHLPVRTCQKTTDHTKHEHCQKKDFHLGFHDRFNTSH